MFLCIGLAGWAAQTVISRGFYALGSTWLPTIVGTVVTAGLVPLYVVLRQHWGAVGLAVASSVSILIYVMLLGWLQRRRFEREAEAKGSHARPCARHAGYGPATGCGDSRRDRGGVGAAASH